MQFLFSCSSMLNDHGSAQGKVRRFRTSLDLDFIILNLGDKIILDSTKPIETPSSKSLSTPLNRPNLSFFLSLPFWLFFSCFSLTIYFFSPSFPFHPFLSLSLSLFCAYLYLFFFSLSPSLFFFSVSLAVSFLLFLSLFRYLYLFSLSLSL